MNSLRLLLPMLSSSCRYRIREWTRLTIEAELIIRNCSRVEGTLPDGPHHQCNNATFSKQYFSVRLSDSDGWPVTHIAHYNFNHFTLVEIHRRIIHIHRSQGQHVPSPLPRRHIRIHGPVKSSRTRQTWSDINLSHLCIGRTRDAPGSAARAF